MPLFGFELSIRRSFKLDGEDYYEKILKELRRTSSFSYGLDLIQNITKSLDYNELSTEAQEYFVSIYTHEKQRQLYSVLFGSYYNQLLQATKTKPKNKLRSLNSHLSKVTEVLSCEEIEHYPQYKHQFDELKNSVRTALEKELLMQLDLCVENFKHKNFNHDAVLESGDIYYLHTYAEMQDEPFKQEIKSKLRDLYLYLLFFLDQDENSADLNILLEAIIFAGQYFKEQGQLAHEQMQNENLIAIIEKL